MAVDEWAGLRLEASATGTKIGIVKIKDDATQIIRFLMKFVLLKAKTISPTG